MSYHRIQSVQVLLCDGNKIQEESLSTRLHCSIPGLQNTFGDLEQFFCTTSTTSATSASRTHSYRLDCSLKQNTETLLLIINITCNTLWGNSNLTSFSKGNRTHQGPHRCRYQDFEACPSRLSADYSMLPCL